MSLTTKQNSLLDDLLSNNPRQMGFSQYFLQCLTKYSLKIEEVLEWLKDPEFDEKYERIRAGYGEFDEVEPGEIPKTEKPSKRTGESEKIKAEPGSKAWYYQEALKDRRLPKDRIKLAPYTEAALLDICSSETEFNLSVACDLLSIRRSFIQKRIHGGEEIVAPGFAEAFAKVKDCDDSWQTDPRYNAAFYILQIYIKNMKEKGSPITQVTRS